MLKPAARLLTFVGLAFFLPTLLAQEPASPGLLAGKAASSTQATDVRTVLREGWLLQDASKVAASGDAVSREDFDTRGWHKAIVPGTVLTSLVADGTYPDPLYGLNNLAIPDSLASVNWWYRTTITGPADDGRKHWLHLDGINYSAELWINGKPLGVMRGAFTRGDFDVTSVLKAGRTNVLALLITPQPHAGTTHQKSLATGTGQNGGITAADGPTFLCTIGWDWIPTIRDRDSGIWQDVSLFETGNVRIENPFVQSKLPLPRTDSADLTVEVTLRNVTDQPQAGVLDGTIGDAKHFQRSIHLDARESKKVIFNPTDTPTLHWEHPKLWWPNGFGDAYLYPLHLSFHDSHGVVSDESDSKVGIREIAYSLPGSENLALVVNGVPVVAKGGNWGLDEALKRIPPERIDAMVRMHQQANYTIIRNWVGQSTEEAFYEACDRYGILIWDEMFQPNPSDGPNPLDAELYLANVKEKLLRYRSHPSIALWCGRNEGDPPPEISRGIAELIRQYDGSRLYQASSTDGRGVHSSGGYYWRAPREFYKVDAPFKTEIGSVSIPTFEAVQAMLPKHSQEVIDEVWAERDLCAGAQRGDQFPHQLAQRYGGFSNLADFVRKGQLATCEAYRAMYEGRFAQLFQPVTGVITWMSNPAQPSFVWQIYSHDLEPNAALFAVRNACEAIHVQLNQANWHLMVVNHLPTTQPHLTATVRIYNLDGTLQQTVAHELSASASAVTDCGVISFKNSLSTVHFLQLKLTNDAQQTFSQNFYWRGLDEDNLTMLDSLPAADLSVTAHRLINGSEAQIAVTIKNPSRVVALMTHLQLRNAKTGQRVLPVYYDDNYFSLVPGESRELMIRAPRTSVGEEGLQLAVDGWNVGLSSTDDGEDVPVILNAPAMARSLKPSTTPAESEDALRINCGGARTTPIEFGKPVSAPGVFEKDSYTRGGTPYSDDDRIIIQSGSTTPASVYATGRRGQLSYDLPAKHSGSYTVILHFAESEVDAVGRRFDVLINGQTVLKDFDIAGEVGRGRALVKTFYNVPAAQDRVSVSLRRGPVSEPTICAIELVPEASIAASQPTPPP